MDLLLDIENTCAYKKEEVRKINVETLSVVLILIELEQFMGKFNFMDDWQQSQTFKLL